MLGRRIRSTLCTIASFLALGAAPALAAEDYVALGDSYSSGTGTRSYYDSGCQRSDHSYAKIIDVERPATDVDLVACAGAKTGDVINTQVKALSRRVEWVTITIGGNDAGFSRVITECAKPWWAADCHGEIDQAQAYITGTLPGQLDSTYAAIRKRASNAAVIVLSYPRLFMGEDCNAGTWFSSSEMQRLNETADLLRDVTFGRADAAGFMTRDAIPPFIGHAVCSDTEWINGLSNPLDESYHPNRDGHRFGYVPLVRAVMG